MINNFEIWYLKYPILFIEYFIKSAAYFYACICRINQAEEAGQVQRFANDVMVYGTMSHSGTIQGTEL